MAAFRSFFGARALASDGPLDPQILSMAWSLDGPEYTVAVTFDQPMDTSFSDWAAFDLSDGIGAQRSISGGWTSPTEINLICEMDATSPPPEQLVYTPPVNPAARLKSAEGVELPAGIFTGFSPA